MFKSIILKIIIDVPFCLRGCLTRHNAFSFHLHVARRDYTNVIPSCNGATHPCLALQFLYRVHHLYKGEWVIFFLTSLGTRQAGSLAMEWQRLTLSIIQLADKDWLINKNSLLTQMTIYPSLSVRWWVISHINHSCFLCIILWLHFLSWMFSWLWL